MQRLSVSFLILGCLLLCGCKDEPQTRMVSGVVTLDGKPLDDAYVQLASTDGSMPASLDIVDGKFSGSVLLGEKTVRFFAMRPAKRDPRLSASDASPPFKNVLPNNYGYGSKIKLNIDSEDLLDLKYELESK